MLQENTQWFVLTSKPREEQRAFNNLSLQGYDVYLPKIAKIVKRKGVKSVSLSPLFPNYLFIRLNSKVENFNAIRSTRGVGSFVRFGKSQSTIADNIIQGIKQSLEGEEENKTLEQLLNFTENEQVDVTHGPFKGLQAIYKAKDGLERSILMVNMLGQENEMTVDNQHFEKAQAT
jgi:transcriptional antiterminator RfaH